MSSVSGNYGANNIVSYGDHTGASMAAPAQQSATPRGGNPLPDPDPKPSYWTRTTNYSQRVNSDGGSTEQFGDDRGDSVTYEYGKDGKRRTERDFESMNELGTSGKPTTYTYGPDGQRSAPQAGPARY
jgi:hypothetical protein